MSESIFNFEVHKSASANSIIIGMKLNMYASNV